MTIATTDAVGTTTSTIDRPDPRRHVPLGRVVHVELRTAEGGLEEMFLQLTSQTQREGKAA